MEVFADRKRDVDSKEVGNRVKYFSRSYWNTSWSYRNTTALTVQMSLERKQQQHHPFANDLRCSLPENANQSSEPLAVRGLRASHAIHGRSVVSTNYPLKQRTRRTTPQVSSSFVEFFFLIIIVFLSSSRWFKTATE